MGAVEGSGLLPKKAGSLCDVTGISVMYLICPIDKCSGGSEVARIPGS
jgi:hypothetical protein